jgi:hypothetical protein
MAFRPINYEEGKVVHVPAATSTTVVKGDCLIDNGSGLLTVASSGTAVDINYVAAESVVTTSNGQLVACIPTRGVRFEADCDAAPAQTDVGTLADLASVSTINPDASSNDLFFIEKIDLTKGAVGTSTVVTGFFQHANES